GDRGGAAAVAAWLAAPPGRTRGARGSPSGDGGRGRPRARQAYRPGNRGTVSRHERQNPRSPARDRGMPVPRRGGRGSTRPGGAVARAGAGSGGGGGTGRVRRSRGVRKGFPALVRGAPVGVQGTPEAPLLTFPLVRASPPSERRLPHADS